jgi:hypothetical protein
MNKENKKKIVVVSLQIVVVVLFILGTKLSNQSLRIIYYSYFADIFLPFGFYFLLFPLQDMHSVFENWQVKALSIFLLCATSEILQFFGIYALASVFDPLDFVMYGIGVLAAAFIDKKLLSNLLSFWD